MDQITCFPTQHPPKSLLEPIYPEEGPKIPLQARIGESVLVVLIRTKDECPEINDEMPEIGNG
jgi:hypothetical protein